MPTRLYRFRSLAALVLLAGCQMPDFLSYPPQVRGNKVDADDLSQLVAGTSTRQDVEALLGSPTAKGAFDENTWIYAEQITRPVIGGYQGVDAQRVIVMTFDAKGVLTALSKRNLADASKVDVVTRTTPSPGTEASFVQQLLGNVGRFNTTSPSSSAGSSGSNSAF